jgi:hypothetical protein
MQSPFKIFRKHQKIALAGLTLMAMVGFGLGDVFMRMTGSARGKRVANVIFETNIGNLSDDEISQLRYERQVVHNFIVSAFARAIPGIGQSEYGQQYALNSFGFGGLDENAMLEKWIRMHEAAQSGITVADSQIDDYIEQIGQKKLTKNDFREIVERIRISPKKLYELFRTELEVRTARMLTLSGLAPSPEKIWQHYQQLKTQEKIAVAAIPVDSFLGKVGEPTEANLTELFAKHQYELESAANGKFRPGFLQPRQVKLQYLELTYDDAKKIVEIEQPITEAEIEDYYEKNKALNRRFQEPPALPANDQQPLNPEMTPEQKEGEEANPGPKLENPDEGEKQPESSGDPQPDAPKSDAPKSDDASPSDPAPGEKSETEETKPAPNCGEDEKPEPAKSENDPAPTEPAAEPAAEKPSPQAEQPAVPVDSKDESAPAAQEKPAAEGEKAGESKPADSEDKPKLPEIKYKPLEEVKDIVREMILAEKIRKFTDSRVDKVREAMAAVAMTFSQSKEVKLEDPNDVQAAELEHRSTRELKQIASQFGMTFNETGLVTPAKLSAIAEYGDSYDAESRRVSFGSFTKIADRVFGGRDRLCRPFVTELIGGTRYVSWVILDVAPHIPKYTDAGIREQVAAAWKRLEAQPLAEKRAEELAKLAREKGQDLKTALDSQTVTGTSVGSALTVIESDPFSYFEESTAADPRAQRRRIRFGNPAGVTNPGRDFMHTVFEQLADGDIGVALNDDATVFYVVKVFDRRPADREEFKDARLFDGPSAMTSVLQFEAEYERFESGSRLREKYAIRQKSIPQGGRGAPEPDEDQ